MPRRRLSLPPFIIISGKGDDATAIATLKLGAADYIAKREGYLDQLTSTIGQAIAHNRLNRVNEQLQSELAERTRTEEAVRESESRFRATFEQAAVGLAHVAPDGCWLRVNQKLCEILGYTREELLEGTFREITYSEDLASSLESLRQLLAAEIEAFSAQKRYFRRDGSLIWINLTATPCQSAVR